MRSSPRLRSALELAGRPSGCTRLGFRHVALVEIDTHAVGTLRKNIDVQKAWAWEKEHCDLLPPTDVKEFEPARDLKKSGELLQRDGLDLLAGGVPCPPFSHAGKQLGKDDERDLFPRMMELVQKLNPAR